MRPQESPPTLCRSSRPVHCLACQQTILQELEWQTKGEQINSNPEVLCRMPFLLQPFQLTQAWDWHRSILAIYSNGLVRSLRKHQDYCSRILKDWILFLMPN